jgi:hypothetical protein
MMKAYMHRQADPSSPGMAPQAPHWLVRVTLYCLTVYRLTIYYAAMPNQMEDRQSLDPPDEPEFAPHQSALWILTLTLPACALGAILFLMLVVAPSAGAAGGCGGG